MCSIASVWSLGLIENASDRVLLRCESSSPRRFRSSLATIQESTHQMTTRAFDRHRGGGHPPTPATPPCVRVRTRRFELVTLAAIDQRWKSERCEVSIGKPNREGFGPGQIPGAESAAGRVIGQSWANPQC